MRSRALATSRRSFDSIACWKTACPNRYSSPSSLQIASDSLGQPYQYKSIDHDAYFSQDAPAANLIANMFEYMKLNPAYIEALDPVEAKELTSGNLVSVRAFFEDHKEEMLGLGPKA